MKYRVTFRPYSPERDTQSQDVEADSFSSEGTGIEFYSTQTPQTRTETVAWFNPGDVQSIIRIEQ